MASFDEIVACPKIPFILLGLGNLHTKIHAFSTMCEISDIFAKYTAPRTICNTKRWVAPAGCMYADFCKHVISIQSHSAVSKSGSYLTFYFKKI